MAGGESGEEQEHLKVCDERSLSQPGRNIARLRTFILMVAWLEPWCEGNLIRTPVKERDGIHLQ